VAVLIAGFVSISNRCRVTHGQILHK